MARRHQQAVRVRVSKGQDAQLSALSRLVRVGHTVAYRHGGKSGRKGILGEQLDVGGYRYLDASKRYAKNTSTKARAPRRKSAEQYPSVQIPADKCVLGIGYIDIPVVGVLKSRIKNFDFGGLSGDFVPLRVTIKRVRERYWDVSVSYKTPPAQIAEKGVGVVGVDINTSNTCGIWVVFPDGTEDGWVVDLPDTSKADEDIRYYSDELLGKQRGSKHYLKTERLLERAKQHRAEIIKQHHLQIVRDLVSLHPSAIVFEAMDLRDEGYHGWKKVAVNQLRRALDDRGRAKDNGAIYATVNRAYTTMTCSDCGSVKEMAKADREYVCPKCEMVMNRDLNSARNIAKRYLSKSLVGTTTDYKGTLPASV